MTLGGVQVGEWKSSKHRRLNSTDYTSRHSTRQIIVHFFLITHKYPLDIGG